MRRANIAKIAAIALLLVLALGTPTQAALRAPTLLSPAPSATSETAPTFTWGAVKGAAQYEFQLSDDARFTSIVLGRGRGLGEQKTNNTAATLTKTIPDGTYFWRVRALDSKDRVGRWSAARTMRKAWTTAPVLVAPNDESLVSWPAAPLLLRWEPVKYATKYLVTIATDPSLAQPVAGVGNKPVEAPGTSFALQGTLSAGRYYWAVTPLDGGNLPGRRSRIGAFSWNWPTATTPTLSDLNPTEQVFDPLFGWDLIPGAARYEVEINTDDSFAAGSRVCCDDKVIGTSLSPRTVLPNNNDIGAGGYHWRVRAHDVDGNPGQWNRGATFEKAYDHPSATNPATVPNLHLEDHDGTLPASASTVTGGPIVAWDRVPGAAKYNVQWTVYAEGTSTCDWSGVSAMIKTSALYWTPLSPTGESGVPGGVGITSGLDPNGSGARSGQPFTNENQDGSPLKLVNAVYCVRVRAVSDDSSSANGVSRPVISEWSYVGGGENSPAFRYDTPTNTATSGPTLPAPEYIAPRGALVTRTPLLRWKPVDGAIRYFVIVARDSNFTNVVDAAFTAQTSYAPNWVLTDEATSYFWAVIPARTANGSAISGGPKSYAPQTFNKQSVPPAPMGPTSGIDVSTQPTFRWSETEGAQKYRVQVSADPNFGEVLDDVVTASTAYTSSTPYPVDTVLYWRVRAEQLQALKSGRVALRWSETATFRRRLPVPSFTDGIPLSGELPPALTWHPVPGAISYGVHIDEADGDSNDFTIKSAAGTFSKFFGIGTFRFKVRANFSTGSGAIAGAYSEQRSFTRVISSPNSPRVTRSKGRIIFGWSPAAAAQSYQVEVSTTQGFAGRVESVKTTNTSWAPQLSSEAYKGSGPLYWRVATVDDGGNVGAWLTSAVRKGKQMTVRVRGTLRRNRTARIVVSVRGSGKALSGASVRASGAGVRATTKRTNRRGSVTLRLRPRQRGSVTILVKRAGYADKSVAVRVR